MTETGARGHGADDPAEGRDDDLDQPVPVDADLTRLAAEELRRRTEAPLPRSLLDFLE
jgi:hypothetical protein